MRMKRIKLRFLATMVLVGLAAASVGAEESQDNSAKEPPKKGRAQLWDENCSRCHNLRSPSSYSDAKWEVIMTHMRIRANLSAEDARAILEFLKEGN